MYVCRHIFTHAYIYIYTYTYIPIYIYTYIHIYIYTYIHIYIYTYIHIYIYTYIHIYIYTYIHIYLIIYICITTFSLHLDMWMFLCTSICVGIHTLLPMPCRSSLRTNLSYWCRTWVQLCQLIAEGSTPPRLAYHVTSQSRLRPPKKWCLSQIQKVFRASIAGFRQASVVMPLRSLVTWDHQLIPGRKATQGGPLTKSSVTISPVSFKVTLQQSQ